MSGVVAVVGGGVAGCAAAVAAARAGARCVLIEREHGFGGVATAGEHLTICGLAALDSDDPELLEPELVGDWVKRLATGGPFRQGRVWLWPTSAAALGAGLAEGVRAAGVEVRTGQRVVGVEQRQGAISALRLASRHDPAALSALPCDRLIDASGGPEVAGCLQLPCQDGTQWGALRATLRLAAAAPPSRARRVALLRAVRQALDGDAAIALTPLPDGLWQLSVDAPPGAGRAAVEPLVAGAARALHAEVVAIAAGVAHRDQGRPVGALTLQVLFAQRERGLCWASWPREEHTAHGVEWSYPDHPRYGVPRQAVEIPAAPAHCFFIGKGMPVTVPAASALRVIGTALAIGTAVGVLAAKEGGDPRRDSDSKPGG